MRNLYLMLAGILMPLFLSAQTRPKSEAERRAWADHVYKEAVLNHDSLQLAEAYYLRGKLEAMTTGNYLRTRIWYLKSLWIQEKHGPSYELARLYLRLGVNEQTHGKYEEALRRYHKSLNISKIIKSGGVGEVNALVHLGNFYADYGESPSDYGKYNPYINYDSAAWYYDKAGQLALRIRDKEGITEITAAKEKLSLMQGKGMDHFRMNLAALNVTGQRNMIEIRTLLRLAESYIDNGDFSQARLRLDKARQIHNEYLSFDRESARLISSAYLTFYEKQGDWLAAYQLQKQQIDKERREHMALNRAVDISELREFYEAEQKEIVLQNQERELSLYRENIGLQRRSLKFVGLLSAVMVLSTLLFYRLYRKNKIISRQNALLVQEQSHRFRNHLQVVSDLLGMQSSRIDADSAQKAMEESHLRLEAMSVLHSKLYHQDKLNTLRLDHFFREIIDVVLKAFAFKHVEVSYSVKPVEVTPDEGLPLGLIMNELTTNACKYAFADHPAPRYEVTADISGHDLILKVSDNGPSKDKTTFNTSFGMKIIALQVRQLNGEHHFSENNGWTFEMRYRRFKPVRNIFNSKPETV